MRSVALVVAFLIAPAPAGADAARAPRDPDRLVDDLGDATCRVEHARAEPARGCRRHVRRRGDRLELASPVEFDLDRAVLRPASAVVLDELAWLLHDHPALVIEIQGHRGVACDDCAVDLSERRARVVRAYLIDHGVDPDRMIARGYGDTVPLVVARTAADRRRNTRIELHVVPAVAPTP